MKRLEASDWTPAKQARFTEFMTRYAPIWERIQLKRHLGPMFYWDMTTGSGLIRNGQASLDGSPLIALEEFRKQWQLRVNCLFTEFDPEYADSLKEVLAERYRGWTEEERQRVSYQVEVIDHLTILDCLRHDQLFKCCGYGLLYWDGLGENKYPAEKLNRWLTKYGWHDLLVMASATVQKRAGRARLDILLQTPKTIIAVSNPVGPFEWIFGLGTNWETLPKKLSKKNHLEFHLADSKEGKRIIDIVGTTREEREARDQGRLWETDI